MRLTLRRPRFFPGLKQIQKQHRKFGHFLQNPLGAVRSEGIPTHKPRTNPARHFPQPHSPSTIPVHSSGMPVGRAISLGDLPDLDGPGASWEVTPSDANLLGAFDGMGNGRRRGWSMTYPFLLETPDADVAAARSMSHYFPHLRPPGARQSCQSPICDLDLPRSEIPALGAILCPGSLRYHPRPYPQSYFVSPGWV